MVQQRQQLRTFFFWDELAILWEVCGDNWCFGGDVNVVWSVMPSPS